MTNIKYSSVLIILLFLLLVVNSLWAASGFGTSKITLTSTNITVSAGATKTVGYNITIATGNTWGTDINVVNNQQLSSQGINVTLSNPGGPAVNPPFNGTMTIAVSSSTAVGSYNVILNATVDDPSTNNTILVVNVKPQVGTTTVYVPSTVSKAGSDAYLYLIPAVVILLIMAYFLTKKKAPSFKMIVAGIALILVGTLIWLYGDFGGNLVATWLGIIVLVIGTLLWIYGDYKGGAFFKNLPPVTILGIILIVVGTVLWGYADLGGNFNYIWLGVVAILVGTIIWTYDDYVHHMLGVFGMKKS